MPVNKESPWASIQAKTVLQHDQQTKTLQKLQYMDTLQQKCYYVWPVSVLYNWGRPYWGWNVLSIFNSILRALYAPEFAPLSYLDVVMNLHYILWFLHPWSLSKHVNNCITSAVCTYVSLHGPIHFIHTCSPHLTHRGTSHWTALHLCHLHWQSSGRHRHGLVGSWEIPTR